MGMPIITWRDDSGASDTLVLMKTFPAGYGEMYLLLISPLRGIQTQKIQAGQQFYLMCKFAEGFRGLFLSIHICYLCFYSTLSLCITSLIYLIIYELSCDEEIIKDLIIICNIHFLLWAMLQGNLQLAQLNLVRSDLKEEKQLLMAFW